MLDGAGKGFAGGYRLAEGGGSGWVLHPVILVIIVGSTLVL